MAGRTAGRSAKRTLTRASDRRRSHAVDVSRPEHPQERSQDSLGIVFASVARSGHRAAAGRNVSRRSLLPIHRQLGCGLGHQRGRAGRAVRYRARRRGPGGGHRVLLRRDSELRAEPLVGMETAGKPSRRPRIRAVRARLAGDVVACGAGHDLRRSHRARAARPRRQCSSRSRTSSPTASCSWRSS